MKYLFLVLVVMFCGAQSHAESSAVSSLLTACSSGNSNCFSHEKPDEVKMKEQELQDKLADTSAVTATTVTQTEAQK